MSQRYLLASVISALVFAMVAGLVLTNVVSEQDVTWSRSLAESLSSQRRFLVRDFTALGSEAVLSAVFVGGLMVLVSLRRGRDAKFFALTVIAVRFLNLAIKALIGRERPAAEETALELSSFSFPSGHSAMSIVIYGMLLLMFLPHLESRSSRMQVSIYVIVVVFLIGLSRILLGVHFLTDVVGGWTLGLACLFGAAARWSLPQPSKNR